MERSQPAENGFQRLFVRELVGVFELLWPCSFQHPTLRDVASWLTEQSGLTFSVLDADYSDRPIPHFTHSGTGYQLLDNLRQACGITDYVWYQLPDGGVYTGGAEKALFADRPIEIPHEFNLGAAAGNSMTLPLVQSLRPGVELNGEGSQKSTCKMTRWPLPGHPATVPRLRHCKKRPFSAKLKAIIRSWRQDCICPSLAA